MDKVLELRKNKKSLEGKLKVKISLTGKKATIEGEALDEYVATRVLDAMSFGFSADTALLLIEDDFSLEILSVRDFTRRKNLEVVKGRLIGTHGKTKNTLEEISGCNIILKDNEVGIIGPSETIGEAITGVTNLIRGTKQGNVYRYLERQNREKRKRG